MAATEEDEQRIIRELLAEVADVKMPAHVVDRVLAALALEARATSSTNAGPTDPSAPNPDGAMATGSSPAAPAEASPVAPVSALPRRRARTKWILPLGAAAGFAVLAGLVLTDHSGDSPAPVAAGEAACSITVAPDSDLTPVMHSTGTEYTQASMVGNLRQLIGPNQNCKPGPTAQGDGAAAAVQAVDVSVSDCLLQIVPGKTLIAVDRGRFRGQDVVVMVTRDPGTRALVVDCSPPPATVMYQTAMP